jgi:hypothetical protein
MIDRIFIKISDALGTNSAIVLFVLIATVPLCFQLPATVGEWQNWLSQTFIQLVCLAILQKGTRVESDRQAALILETHDAAVAMRAEENARAAERHEESMGAALMLKNLTIGCCKGLVKNDR